VDRKEKNSGIGLNFHSSYTITKAIHSPTLLTTATSILMLHCTVPHKFRSGSDEGEGRADSKTSRFHAWRGLFVRVFDDLTVPIPP
jgi:hypothetical protein